MRQNADLITLLSGIINLLFQFLWDWSSSSIGTRHHFVAAGTSSESVVLHAAVEFSDWSEQPESDNTADYAV